MAGKPDLIAVKGSEAVIIDAKTGKPSPSHAAQVLIYMHALPKSLEEYRGVQFRAHAVYPDSQVGIPVSAVDDRFVDNLGGLIRRLAAETPARRVPSAQECAFCDITKADCSERIGDADAYEGEHSRLLTKRQQGTNGPDRENCKAKPGL